MIEQELEKVLALPGKELQDGLADLLAAHGPAKLDSWTDVSKHANRLVHRLTILGNAAGLELLAEGGIDINAQRSSDGCTPLHLAIWHGQPAVAQALRRVGASAGLANSYGETAHDAEQQQNRRYICWHQQADLLVNISPIVLRRLFRESWALHVGNDLEIGTTILHGSEHKVVVSDHASVRRGSSHILVEENIVDAISKGQSIWLKCAEVEAAGEPIWTPPVGRILGSCEVPLEKPWAGADVRNGRLQVQRVPPEPRLPPGTDAYKKIRSGRVDLWDLTLLGHFLGEEHCRLACRLVPQSDKRQLVRQLKDARNKVCLHQGRTEVEPDVVDRTAQLLLDACDVLMPASSQEVQLLVAEARSRTVVPESVLEQMEQQLREERSRAKLMEDCVSSVSRFRDYLPPSAFAATSVTEVASTDAASEWSATRGESVWISVGPLRVCHCAGELLKVLALPPQCDASVVLRCIELAAECPHGKSLLLVIRVATSQIGDVMLERLGNPDVHKRWKDQRLIVADVTPTAELFEDWCLADGVLVSGEHGRLLRVTAQFRPPEGTRRAQGPTLGRALDVACMMEAVVVVSEGGKVYASTSEQARQNEYFQLSADARADSDCDTVSVSRGAATMTEIAVRGGNSTAQKVGGLFWPHMQQREQLTQTLLPQAAEQVRRWGNGTTEINAETAELASENTAKWLWTFICSDRPRHAILAAQKLCGLVLARLQELGLETFEPRLLIPMGESHRILGKAEEAMSLLHRARKLASQHRDFENGASAHHMLFNIYVRLDDVCKARAMLVGAQLLLDTEKASQRSGIGMDDFFRAKCVFLRSNQARLDAKLALRSEDISAVQGVKTFLEDIIAEMQEMQGSQFRGNTDRNMAELLCLLCKVAWACADTKCARHALERELPLRRKLPREGEALVPLTNLGRACLETGDVDAAEKYLVEAELTIQGLVGPTPDAQGGVSSDLAIRQEILGMLAECAERQGDFQGALSKLKHLAEVWPKSIDRSSVDKEILRVQALCSSPQAQSGRSTRLAEGPAPDIHGLGDVAPLAEGGRSNPKAMEETEHPKINSKGGAKKKKSKPARKK